MSLHLSGIDYESFADAEGVSCVLFFSYCTHNCEGCHSPQTHRKDYGVLFDSTQIDLINKEIAKRPFLNSLVLSGGDPMFSAKEILEILPKLDIPNNNIWIYSGFTFEQIQENKYMSKLLGKCNVLIDGLFEINKRDITLQFRGSSNQRIIDIQQSLDKGEIVLWREKES